MEITGENYLPYDFIVFVSYCFYDKLLQTQWLKITQIDYITVSDVRNSKIKVLTVWFSSGVSKGDSIFLPFPVSRGNLHLLVYGPFLHLYGQRHNIFNSLLPSSPFFHLSASIIISPLAPTLQPPPSEDFCDYIGFTWIIQHDLLISKFLT